MAKKKSKKSMSQSASPSMLESLGLRHISQVFQNERLHFFLGMLLFALSVCLTWAFVSYFTTGAADQSIIENLREGDLENEPLKFGNAVGSLGAYAAYFFMNHCFGVSSFGLPLLMFLFSLALMKAYKPSLLKWFICVAVVMEWFSVALAKFATPLCSSSHFCPGGEHGLYVCRLLERYIGSPGLVAILIIVAILFLMYVSSETIVWIRKILNPMGFVRKVKFTVNNNDTTEVAPDDSYENLIQTEEDPEVFDNPQTQVVDFGQQKTVVEPVVTTMEQKDEPEIEITVAGEEEKADDTENPQVDVDNLEPYDPKRDLENYHYPTLDLLNTYESDGKPYIDMEEQTANKNRIIEVLRTFGIEISSIKATVGPTITLYEITPAQGVRISKIRGLEDDIALSLKALGIRIIAPIPGKGTIGIEVPNAKANIVSMESILNSKKFQETTMELPCAMGKTITNEVFMFDLAKAPHLIVAGATGQGKSVGLNAILTSLLYKKHPAEMKIVLVDPKMVEFSIYAKIANHFLAKVPDDNASPIITDTTKVIRTLQSL